MTSYVWSNGQTIYLKTTSLLRSNHCTCYSSDRLHLTRGDRALCCCASTVTLSDGVQRLCTLDLCARATLCLDALFNTPLALNTRVEDNVGVVTLHDTGHGVFQLIEQIRCVGGEIRVLVGKAKALRTRNQSSAASPKPP